MIVYAWPPVGARGQSWSVHDPVAVSRSLVTGRRFVSRGQPRRRVVRFEVGGAKFGGYMEALTRLIEGGEHGVRLRSHPLIWKPSDFTGAEPMAWFSESDPMSWLTGSQDMIWLTGDVAVGAITTLGGLPALQVSGLPPSARVIKVGEFLSVYPEFGSNEGAQTRMALRDTMSDANGVAVIVVDRPFTITGRVDLASQDTAVFEPVNIPRPTRQVGQEWIYDWEFREVFPEEVGGFEEVNPW